MQSDKEKRIPCHVSIIMDGNGRWAQERGLKRVEGHFRGEESVRKVTEESIALGVKYLSLYAFSTENWGRPKEEVNYLMSLMFKSIMGELENMLKNGVRFVVLGDRTSLPKDLNDVIDRAMVLTSEGKNLTLIVFVSYSGKWDILQAAKSLAADAASSENPADFLEGITDADFSSRLVTAGIPDPDLIIRTSGEQRISNYLLWQGAYSEFYFTKVLWPDFDKEEYRKAIEEFASRDRRYGKVK